VDSLQVGPAEGDRRHHRRQRTSSADGPRTWNDDPRPCVWIKTADQILDSIATYWQPN
jgi:hypothetical protein